MGEGGASTRRRLAWLQRDSCKLRSAVLSRLPPPSGISRPTGINHNNNHHNPLCLFIWRVSNPVDGARPYPYPYPHPYLYRRGQSNTRTRTRTRTRTINQLCNRPDFNFAASILINWPREYAPRTLMSSHTPADCPHTACIHD